MEARLETACEDRSPDASALCEIVLIRLTNVVSVGRAEPLVTVTRTVEVLVERMGQVFVLWRHLASAARARRAQIRPCERRIVKMFRGFLKIEM